MSRRTQMTRIRVINHPVYCNYYITYGFLQQDRDDKMANFSYFTLKEHFGTEVAY